MQKDKIRSDMYKAGQKNFVQQQFNKPEISSLGHQQRNAVPSERNITGNHNITSHTKVELKHLS